MKLLGSPQAMHAAVLAGFTPDQNLTSEEGRVLWRVDGAGSPTVALYVVSPEAPDFTGLCEQAAWPTRTNWQTKPYAPLLEQLSSGQRWQFRLTANPTHRNRPGPDKDAKITGHVSVAHQTQWLVGKASQHGFHVVEAPGGEPTVSVADRGNKTFRRDTSQVTLTVATFDGVLEVTDADQLGKTLTTGIGRARGYGCGLLTLARP